MRLLIITVLTLFLGVAAKAQTAVANLNITLTDVQTVRIPEFAADVSTQKVQDNSAVEMLSPATSQVKVYSSHNSDIEKLNKEFYTGNSRNSSIITYASNNSRYSKGQTPHNKGVRTAPQLLVYQIDPR